MLAIASLLFAIPSPVVLQENGPPNVVLILIDDLGIDVLRSYSGNVLGVDTTDFPDLPNLDQDSLGNPGALLSNGIAFDNAWSNPTCSPTRGTLQTGRYAFRTLIGKQIASTTDPTGPKLDVDELLIPRFLDDPQAIDNYAHAIFGKWHLTASMQDGDAPTVARALFLDQRPSGNAIRRW